MLVHQAHDPVTFQKCHVFFLGLVIHCENKFHENKSNGILCNPAD